MEETVKKMQNANESTNEAAYLEQRAFVSFQKCDYMPMRTDGADTLVLAPTWYNSGKTPTVDARHFVSYSVSNEPTFEPSYEPQNLLVGPACSAAGMCEVPHTEWGVGKYIFVWGYIEYDDVFKDIRSNQNKLTERHRTQFCYRSYIGNSRTDQLNGIPMVELHFTVFDKYNLSY